MTEHGPEQKLELHNKLAVNLESCNLQQGLHPSSEAPTREPRTFRVAKLPQHSAGW